MLKKTNLVSNLYFILCMLFTSQIHAQNLSESEFKAALEQSVKSLKSTHYEMTSFSGFIPVKGVKYIKANTWNVALQSWLYATGDSTYTKTIIRDAQVTNKGTHFEVVSSSQALLPLIIDEMDKAKFVGKGRKHMMKEANHTEFKFLKENDRLVMVATYDYSKGSSKKDIVKQLTPILNYSRGIMNTYSFHMTKLEKKLLKQMMKMEITSLTDDEFEFLMQNNSLAKFKSKKKTGYWSFSDKKENLGFSIYNNKDALVYYVTRNVKVASSEQERQATLDQLNTLFQKSGVKESTKIEAYYPEKKSLIGVKFTFPYDGSVKGSDMQKSYDTIWDKRGKYAKWISKASPSN